MRYASAGTAAVLTLLYPCSPAPAASPPERLSPVLQKFLSSIEVRETPAPPSWYPPGPVRFRFAQLSDLHLSSSSRPYLNEACRFINEKIKPAFVVLTGDGPGSPGRSASESYRKTLTEALHAPCFFLPGDNWPDSFLKVFGPSKWSFTCGGLYFVGNSLDRDVRGSGVGTFCDRTWKYLRARLTQHRNMPAVYLQHEPFLPPVFLAAPRLASLFEEQGNVVAALAGHLHHDLCSQSGRTCCFVAPALGPHPRHGFKVFEVYTSCLVGRTAARHNGSYRLLHIYQRVPLARSLPPRSEAPVKITCFQPGPAVKRVYDPGLLLRSEELLVPFLRYAAQNGYAPELLKAFLPAGRPSAQK